MERVERWKIDNESIEKEDRQRKYREKIDIEKKA